MKMPAFVLLLLSSVAMSSARAGTDARGSGGRSTYNSPLTENVIELESDPSPGAFCGTPIQIVVPGVGVFPGWLHSDVVDASCARTAGKSPSEVGSEPDYLPFVD